jgi:hypothetical protein
MDKLLSVLLLKVDTIVLKIRLSIIKPKGLIYFSTEAYCPCPEAYCPCPEAYCPCPEAYCPCPEAYCPWTSNIPVSTAF